MRLEDQCCSLELAKELKGLGVKQESAFYWMLSNIDGQWKLTDTVFYEKTTMLLIKEQPERIVSAFTVGELGEMLPTEDERNYTIVTYRGPSGFWFCDLTNFKGESGLYPKVIREETETDARAKMICHLIKTGVVTP